MTLYYGNFVPLVSRLMRNEREISIFELPLKTALLHIVEDYTVRRYRDDSYD